MISRRPKNRVHEAAADLSMADIQFQKTRKNGAHNCGDNRIIGCPIKQEILRFDTAG
jgi:hypothetical protein